MTVQLKVVVADAVAKDEQHKWMLCCAVTLTHFPAALSLASCNDATHRNNNII